MTKNDMARAIVQVLRRLPVLPEPDHRDVVLLVRRSPKLTLVRQYAKLVGGVR